MRLFASGALRVAGLTVLPIAVGTPARAATGDGSIAARYREQAIGLGTHLLRDPVPVAAV
jgi:hypothetical protein